MEAKNIGALAAILVVVIFAGYIIVGGITGFFITVPAAGESNITKTENIAWTLPVEGEASGEPVTGFMPEEPPAGLKESELCEGIVCPPNNTTCPDSEVVSCENTCDPLTGQCSTCSPDCSEHQATGGSGGGGGGGGGGSPPPSSCTDTSWTLQGDWSECSPDGKQIATFRSNCGNTETKTQDCTYISTNATVWISPEAQEVTKGDNITVNIKINTVGEISAFEIVIGFNPNVLDALTVEDGGFLSQNNNEIITIPPTIYNSTVQFAAAIVSQASATGQGVLIAITFNAIASGHSNLTLDNYEIVTEGGNPVNITIENSDVTVA